MLPDRDDERGGNAFVQYEQVDSLAERLNAERAVESTLAWLWEAITKPVLNALGHHGPPADNEPWPRLWWCPTGPLTVLPLHAAGVHGDGTGSSVLDRVVSSYTPTLRALRGESPSPGPSSQNVLVVTVDDIAGLDPLESTAVETAQLRESIPASNLTILHNSAATRSRVRHALGQHAYVHLSCHGSQNLTQPSQASLLVHDGELSLPELVSGHHGGELVTLSACMTATGGATVADEAVSIATALHYTGWRNVVATLWWVWDVSAAAIFSQVYRDIVVTGVIRPDLSAVALHHATRRIRDSYPRHPTRWAPFIHIGIGNGNSNSNSNLEISQSI